MLQTMVAFGYLKTYRKFMVLMKKKKKEIFLQLKNLTKKTKKINVKERERNSSTIIVGDFTPNSHKWTLYPDRNDT